MEVNLNDYAEVVLTDVGARIWNEYEKGFAKYAIPGWEPRLKKEGDTLKQQLWSLMKIYGPHIHLGGAVPFELCKMTIEEKNSA